MRAGMIADVGIHANAFEVVWRRRLADTPTPCRQRSGQGRAPRRSRHGEARRGRPDGENGGYPAPLKASPTLLGSQPQTFTPPAQTCGRFEYQPAQDLGVYSSWRPWRVNLAHAAGMISPYSSGSSSCAGPLQEQPRRAGVVVRRRSCASPRQSASPPLQLRKALPASRMCSSRNAMARLRRDLLTV